jgi:predicted amidophosphoribosyltransferase
MVAAMGPRRHSCDQLREIFRHPAIREAWFDALAVLAPTNCTGCGAADRALCDACRAHLSAAPQSVQLDYSAQLNQSAHLNHSAQLNRLAGPTPLVVWSALDYSGVPRSILLAFKDGSRTDAARALARPLRSALAAALAAAPAGPAVRLAVIPSTRAAFRRRGYHPVELVLAAARLRAEHPLRLARQTADQAGLGLAARAENRAGSLRARRQLRGNAYLIVDDILTTGATILEARRAIEAAGGVVRGAVTIAYTRRRNTR